MAELIAQVADRIDRAVQRVTPFAYRMQRKGRRWMRRAMRKPRSVSEGPNLLPLVDPGAGQFFESRWRFAGGRDRLEPWLSALRLSGSGLLRVAATVSAGALRAAGFNGDGAKAQCAAEHRTQDHARGAALRFDFASGTEAGAGGRSFIPSCRSSAWRRRRSTSCIN